MVTDRSLSIGGFVDKYIYDRCSASVYRRAVYDAFVENHGPFGVV